MRGCDTWQRRALKCLPPSVAPYHLPPLARKSICCLANPSHCGPICIRFEVTRADIAFRLFRHLDCLIGVTMAEERIRTSVRDENREPEKKEVAKDRKSLTGMSDKVKATLAPLLGGIKHHPEVEVDLGRESGAATVPIGSTPMNRYSAVATSDQNPNPDRLHLPVQDVGLSNGVRESGSSMPGHKPNEDKFVLDGSTDPVHRFRSTTPTSEGENPFNG